MAGGGGEGGESGLEGDAMVVDGDDMEDDVVPTVFRWEHGGRQVCVWNGVGGALSFSLGLATN